MISKENKNETNLCLVAIVAGRLILTGLNKCSVSVLSLSLSSSYTYSRLKLRVSADIRLTGADICFCLCFNHILQNYTLVNNVTIKFLVMMRIKISSTLSSSSIRKINNQLILKLLMQFLVQDFFSMFLCFSVGGTIYFLGSRQKGPALWLG